MSRSCSVSFVAASRVAVATSADIRSNGQFSGYCREICSDFAGAQPDPLRSPCLNNSLVWHIRNQRTWLSINSRIRYACRAQSFGPRRSRCDRPSISPRVLNVSWWLGLFSPAMGNSRRLVVAGASSMEVRVVGVNCGRSGSGRGAPISAPWSKPFSIDPKRKHLFCEDVTVRKRQTP